MVYLNHRKEVKDMNRTEKRREKQLLTLKLLTALVPLITALIDLIAKLIDWLSD